MINIKRTRLPFGFTIFEVLLVLALIGLLAGLVAGSASAFITSGDFEPPSRVLKKSVLDALYFSAERKQASYLYYDDENASFVVMDSTGSNLAKHPVFKNLENLDQENRPFVKFFALGPLAGVDGGRTQYNDRSLELIRIPFHFGCSVPFLAQIKFREKDQTHYFDPFSGYPLTKLDNEF